MPRKGEVSKRSINPDPKFKDVVVAKFINMLMYSGKKSVAERIVYAALDKVQEKASDEAVKVFRRAIDNAKPQLEVKSRRVGGSNYQV
ncbi:MAG: 30S ribosomal protein S7, partial [Trueperaceae bacterium]|nr:30S ribosomal protein S7 [Trueperaceae bacterium]